MADRQLRVEITGNADKLNRALGQTETRLKKFSRNVGAVSGSAGFGSGSLLGGLATRGNAIAAGGALAALGIKRVVDASMEAEVVLGQTGVAVNDAGLSWEKGAARIQSAADAISKATAFDDEDVLRSFQVFVRGQKDVEKSLRLSSLAADVARGRYVDLETATQLVNKAAMGQLGALRRAGIQIDKNATSTEALTALTEAYGGSAEAYANTAAGASDKFKVAVENLEEELGKGLLPVLTDTAELMTGLVEITSDFGDAVDKANEKTGGWMKNLLGWMITMKRPFQEFSDAVVLLTSPFVNYPTSPAGAPPGLRGPVGATLPSPGTSAADFFQNGPVFGTKMTAAETARLGVGRGKLDFSPDPAIAEARASEQLAALVDIAEGVSGMLDIEASRLPTAAKYDELIRGSLDIEAAIEDQALTIAEGLADMLGQEFARLPTSDKLDELIRGSRDIEAAIEDQAQAVALAVAEGVSFLFDQESSRLPTAAKLDELIRGKGDVDKALEDAAKELQEAGLALKSAEAERLGMVQEGVDAARAVADTQAALKVAKQMGGPEGIKAATRAFEDAVRQRDILAALGVSWTQARGGMGGVGVGPGFPMGEQITIIINAAQDPEVITQIKKSVIEGLQRSGRLNSPQQRGRAPGRLPIGI